MNWKLRFEAKVDRSGGPDACHLWTGGSGDGYGLFVVCKKDRPGKSSRSVNQGAHRVAWMISMGCPVPAGLWVLHKCDNKRCVNPLHLYAGTPDRNSLDSLLRGQIAIGKGKLPYGVKRAHTAREAWESYYTRKGRMIYVGTHETIEEAAEAALGARQRQLEERSKQNT